MCGSGGLLGTGLFASGGAAPTPAAPVVREDPKAAAAVQADTAAQTAQADKLATSRRRRAVSLLATGGSGDLANPVTGAPVATAGKPTLGA